MSATKFHTHTKQQAELYVVSFEVFRHNFMVCLISRLEMINVEIYEQIWFGCSHEVTGRQNGVRYGSVKEREHFVDLEYEGE